MLEIGHVIRLDGRVSRSNVIVLRTAWKDAISHTFKGNGLEHLRNVFSRDKSGSCVIIGYFQARDRK